MNNSSLYEAAAWLAAHGFSVIAVDHPSATHFPDDPSKVGKVPVASWKAFQVAHASPDNLRAWFGAGVVHNPAIVTGAVSGVVVVDGDSPAALAWMAAHLPPTEMRTRTAKGEHWFYQHPGGHVRNSARLQTEDHTLEIDVRGDGGYVIAPGAVHASGARYERLGAWPAVSALPVFDPRWLAGEPPQVARLAPRPTAADPSALLTRARAYVARVPGAVEGQGGDTHTFQLACKLSRGFGLSDAETLDLLLDWNPTCTPPWAVADLEQKIESARKYGREAVGAKAVERRVHGGDAPRAIAQDDDRSPHAEDEDLPPIRTYLFTDSGNAECLADREAQHLRYDHRRARWLLWDGHRWAPDRVGAVRQRAKAAMRERLRAAADEDTEEVRKKAIAHALRSESRSALDALTSLAQSEAPLADAGDQWDTHAWWLGVPNGVIDLRTGLVRHGARSDRITMHTRTPYAPDAACPRWEEFLADIFAGDLELLTFVHRAIGYSLTADTSEQCLFMGWGTGSNGKSTLTRTLAHVLGDYADNMAFSTIELNQRQAIPNDLAALVGRRFVTAGETNDGTRLNESRIKALTGGDPITARFLQQEFFTFHPVAKFWLSVNHKPIVKDDSFGFWRRMRLIPFTQAFPLNAALGQELRDEAPGILAWAVRGCLDWQRHGLAAPAAVMAATDTYATESDPLADFLAEHCTILDGLEVGAASLAAAYTRWADGRNLGKFERLSGTKLGRKISERFTKEARREGAFYLGIGLVS